MKYEQRNRVSVSMEDMRRWLATAGVTLPDKVTFEWKGEGSQTTDPLVLIEWDEKLIGGDAGGTP